MNEYILFVLRMLMVSFIWILMDIWHIRAYKRCKKKCGQDKCKEWMCKYYHEARKDGHEWR